eukprot:scaffold19719_cov101-Isochrysis_galbana.AAC.1
MVPVAHWVKLLACGHAPAQRRPPSCGRAPSFPVAEASRPAPPPPRATTSSGSRYSSAGPCPKSAPTRKAHPPARPSCAPP